MSHGNSVHLTGRLSTGNSPARSQLIDKFRCALASVPFNTMFAWSVVDSTVDGEIWCDVQEAPTLAHLIHPYGMTLLMGLTRQIDSSALFEHLQRSRRTRGGLWMQLHPQCLSTLVDQMLEIKGESFELEPSGTRAERFTRTNFRFSHDRYRSSRPTDGGLQVRPMTASEFDLGGIGVSPKRFWRTADDFFANGGGWCVARGTDVLSIAFSSFRRGSRLEIGVETLREYQGLGLAKFAASAIIDQCLSDGLEPVWSCRLQNKPSYRLAQSMGFVPIFEGAYYHLPSLIDHR